MEKLISFRPLWSLFILMPTFAHASAVFESARDQSHRYPSFAFSQGQAVFPDFLKAHYSIIFDGAQTITDVVSEIDFEQAEAGYPVFDLVNEPTQVMVDGVATNAPQVKTPDGATTLRVVNFSVSKGAHHLTIHSPLTRMSPAINGFFMDDSVERCFLERYVPASFEYDHVPMSFDVRFQNFPSAWKVYANGVQTANGPNAIHIEFPAYFTASSLFFHAVPANFAQETRFNFRSLSGKVIPILTYLEPTETGLNVSPAEITEDLSKLEKLYGPFPHASITIYFGKSHVDHFNDMEYSGATIATPDSLYHELAHSYFARGVMPANGNSNWIDEAIADWTENDLANVSVLPAPAKLASLPVYARFCWNISRAYGMSSILGYLNQTYRVRDFLKDWQQLRFGQSVTTEEFIQDLENYLGVSLMPQFQKLIY